MEFEVRAAPAAGDRTVVTVIGELDAHVAPDLQTCLDPLLARSACAIVVDLSGVPFIDSTGLGVLVTTLKRVREADGSLDVVVTAPRVLKVFALTGLDVVIPLHATLAEALADRP
jgi:anti-sigma B factor antagonist